MTIVPIARLAAAVLALIVSGPVAAGDSPARRVVSMNPSLTEILIALGAADRLVGVDEYSARVTPAVADMPTVGGLFNPNLESVVALQPDLVALVPSIQQRDFRSRLGELGIPVLALQNHTLPEALHSIEALGERVGKGEAARTRVREIRRAWSEVADAVKTRPRLSGVLVIQREPLYVVGGGSFLDAMLRAAGIDNAAGARSEAYPRVGMEWVVAAAPAVILDASEDARAAEVYWARWPSLPAVAEGRVIAVPTGEVTRPGPHLDRALRLLARAVHGSDIVTRAP